MEDTEKPPAESATFNNAAEYCKSLIIIERSIAENFKVRNFIGVNEDLELLWMELYEWFSKDEEEEQNKIRNEAFESVKRINDAVKLKKNSVDTKDVEILKFRAIMLKKIIHKYGLRMYKGEDMSGTPSLMRPAKLNYRR